MFWVDGTPGRGRPAGPTTLAPQAELVRLRSPAAQDGRPPAHAASPRRALGVVRTPNGRRVRAAAPRGRAGRAGRGRSRNQLVPLY